MINQASPPIPKLVAHRGYAKKYPENTFPAIEAAINCGACYIEIDIQFTFDGIAVLCHDESLLRTTGHDELITETVFSKLKQYPVLNKNYPAVKNENITIPCLQDVITYLKNINNVMLFVEIKDESLDKFGLEKVMTSLLETIKPLKGRAILISYNHPALEYAQQHRKQAIGWIIKKYTEKAQKIAIQLKPDYLFCNYKKIRFSTLWQGGWKWVLYEITKPELALELASTGVELIETMEIGILLEHPLLKKQRCSHDRTV